MSGSFRSQDIATSASVLAFDSDGATGEMMTFSECCGASVSSGHTRGRCGCAPCPRGPGGRDLFAAGGSCLQCVNTAPEVP